MLVLDTKTCEVLLSHDCLGAKIPRTQGGPCDATQKFSAEYFGKHQNEGWKHIINRGFLTIR